MSIRAIPVAGGLLAILIGTGVSCFADDVIYTRNGDRITGEIKKLQEGVIHIDPSYGENVFEIDWDDVERLETKRSFVVETSGGERVSGTIAQSPDNTQELTVEDDSGPVKVERPDIVAVLPFDMGVWNRMDVNVDLGVTVTAANTSKQANLNALVSYTAEDWRLQGGYNLLRNTIGDEQTRRWEGDVNYRRLIRKRWFGLIGVNFLNSDELQLDLRTTLAPGFGRFLKRTNQMYWSVSGGGQWTNEKFAGLDLGARNSVEGWAGTEISLFNWGDVGWLTQFKVSPGLTEPGRLRIDFNTDFKIDLPKDLYFRIGLRDNFDSRPSNDTPKNDYIFSMGVGWKL